MSNLSSPVVEFDWDIHIANHMEEIIVPDNLIMGDWICFLSCPNQINIDPSIMAF